MSDYKGVALMLDALPRAKVLLGDKGYDADWFRNSLGRTRYRRYRLLDRLISPEPKTRPLTPLPPLAPSVGKTVMS